MIGYKSSANDFLYPVENTKYNFSLGAGLPDSEKMLKGAGIKQGWKKFTKFMKNVGPKVVKTIMKGADWLSDQPVVQQVAQKVIKETTGVDVPVKEIVENVKSKDVNKILPNVVDVGKSLVEKWKDNNKKIQTSDLPTEDKKQVDETTKGLLQLKISPGKFGKNAEYANLAISKTDKKGALTFSVPKNRLLAVGVNRPVRIGAKDAGRLFQSGSSVRSGLEPTYMVSKITKDGKKGKVDKKTDPAKVDKWFDEMFGK